MSTSSSLPNVQKRILQLTNYEDGLWDLLLGTTFMLLAVYPITRARLGPAWNLVLFIGLLLLSVAGYTLIRWQVSMPRIGYVRAKPSPARKLILAVTIVLVAMTFGLVILTLVSPGWIPNRAPGAGPDPLREYLVDTIVMLCMVGLFSLMGYFFGVSRLYLYGWLVGGGNLAAQMIYQGAPEGFNVPLGLAASVILLIGLVLLVRFLRKYPVQTQEA
jgi:hypothetical protein